ncbi:MAG: hypothetical protein PF545_07695 [Elusimicrobia bacterium]|nr:hypothetical protein [Elusimicrobiota bacterium]
MSSSRFQPEFPELSPDVKKIKSYLEQTREMLYSYKNSGRAKLENLFYIQNKLLIAESGRLTDNISKNEYDRIFRRSIIEIYRKIGLSPPAKFFLPVTKRKPIVPYEGITSRLSVDCDGQTGSGEWQGAYRLIFDSEPVKEFRCGFDGKNIYYRFAISSAAVENISIIAGHMNADAAALYPSGMPRSADNIQDFPISTEVRWRKDIPLKTVIYRASGNEQWEPLTGNYDVGYSGKIIEFSLPFKYLGVRSRKKIYMKVTVNGKVMPAGGRIEITAPKLYSKQSIISNIDPASDNYGPGDYTINEDYEGYRGNTDLKKIDVDQQASEKIITLQFASIDNPGNAPLGFGNALVDIYIDINNKIGLGNTAMFPGRKAYVKPESAWEYAVVISGHEKVLYNSAMDKIGEPEISVSLLTNTINIFLEEDLIETSVENWQVAAIVMAADDDGKMLRVKEVPVSVVSAVPAVPIVPEKYGFNGRKFDSDTNIIDIIVPPGFRQKDILSKNRNGEAIEIPAIKKN